MAEYIEREALLQSIFNGVWFDNQDEDVAYDLVDKAPAADVVEVRHGEWIPIEYDGYADGYPVWDLWECSECQEEHRGDEDTLTPYCPNCGAKMDGKGEGE